MADLLDAEGIKSAQESLPGWSYDGEALVRRVDIPAADQDTLESQVMAEANAMNHHPVVSREGDTMTFRVWSHSDGGEGDTMTFRVWSHSDGGVTSKDVDLAGRIDQVLSSGS
jgi:4a-hydroxytetrahydrobiopterin dehydratase